MRALTCAALAAAAAAQGPLCGNATLPLSTTQKNVLLIGDSISMAVPYTPGGYGAVVQQLLTPKGVFVQHDGGWFAGGQASNTAKGMICTDTAANNSANNPYLDFTGTFDVIHFNYGLHDLEVGPGTEHVDIAVYGQNLATIFSRLLPRTRKLIWASTTPVPNVTTSYGRTYELAVQYNAQALTSLQAAASAAGVELLVDDLWTAVIEYCGAWYTSCDLQIPVNVHFEPKGQQYLGDHVATAIAAALGDDDNGDQ